jgi:hypothetical protein
MDHQQDSSGASESSQSMPVTPGAMCFIKMSAHSMVESMLLALTTEDAVEPDRLMTGGATSETQISS